MFMKAGDPFVGRGGNQYSASGEVEMCDVALAHRFGWVPDETDVTGDPTDPVEQDEPTQD